MLLNVRDGPGYYGDPSPLDADSIDPAQRLRQGLLLDAALAQAKLHDLDKVRAQSTVGPAARQIVQAAADNEVDQIVMGTRGMNAPGGLLLGSVAQRLVHLAPVPVLLVK